MNTKEYFLNKLISEASEVIHAATKVLEFGEDSRHPDGGVTNIEYLRNEIADLTGAIYCLRGQGIILTGESEIEEYNSKALNKQIKILDYLEVCKQIGTVKE